MAVGVGGGGSAAEACTARSPSLASWYSLSVLSLSEAFSAVLESSEEEEEEGGDSYLEGGRASEKGQKGARNQSQILPPSGGERPRTALGHQVTSLWRISLFQSGTPTKGMGGEAGGKGARETTAEPAPARPPGPRAAGQGLHWPLAGRWGRQPQTPPPAMVQNGLSGPPGDSVAGREALPYPPLTPTNGLSFGLPGRPVGGSSSSSSFGTGRSPAVSTAVGRKAAAVRGGLCTGPRAHPPPLTLWGAWGGTERGWLHTEQSCWTFARWWQASLKGLGKEGSAPPPMNWSSGRLQAELGGGDWPLWSTPQRPLRGGGRAADTSGLHHPQPPSAPPDDPP